MHLFGALAPFIGTLLTIALVPQRFPKVWHKHGPLILVSWTFPALLYATTIQGAGHTLRACCHVLFFDYAPFLLLLAALYVIAGGLKLRLHVRPTPLVNVLTLALFTLLASIMGTTGAAMLGLHPLLILNEPRRHKTHTLLFFIFLVCNIGGGLSSIGDPPLFLGFVKGISFMWPTQNLWPPVLFTAVCLLSLYGAVDTYFFWKERAPLHIPYKRPRVHIEGTSQLILIGLVIATLVSSAFLTCAPWLREVFKAAILTGLIILSLHLTPMTWRRTHKWHWHPLQEVAWIFLALFITAHTPIQLLAQGPEGPLGFLFPLLTDASTQTPSPLMYFWTTGLLSSFLDNAPTYLVFLTMTGLDIPTLMTTGSVLLKAISLGAVFMGALTYIGNAPNLLVKTFAEEEYKITMPAFWTYMVLSSLILLPFFALAGFLFLT